MKRRPHRRYAAPGRAQSGAALIFSLIILLIVTILGLTALRTSSLEQLMAGNTQEMTRALEIADSGLDWMLAATPVFRGSTWPQSRNYPDPNPVATATFDVAPAQVQIVGPIPSASPSESHIAHFRHTVTGTTLSTNARTTLTHGVRQYAPTPTGEFRDP